MHPLVNEGFLVKSILGRGRQIHLPFRRAIAASAATALVASVVVVTAVASAPIAAAAAPLLCDQNTVYGIDGSGQIAAINVTTGAATNVVTMSPAVNGLAVAVGGTDAYAFDGSGNNIVRYRASTNATTTIGAVDANAPSSVIRGAYDPANGLYYYAGGGNTAYLGGYNTLTSTKIGQIGSITGLASGTGDFAFSTGGLLFVAASNTVVRVNGTIPATGGNVSLTTSLVATLPQGTNSPAIAFSTDGYLYVTAGSDLIKLDPASGAQVGTTKTISGGFSPFDLASCNYANTVSVRKNVVDRVTGTDQFNLSVTGGGIVSGNTATTTGTANGVQADVAGASLTIPGRVYTVAETAAGTANLANYTSTYNCVNVNNNAVITSGSGSSGSFTFPAAVTAAGTDVVCTFTNTPKNATVALTKALGSTRNADADQFTVAIRSTSASGPVVNATTASTTAGSGTTVTAGTGVTGTTTVVANRPYFFTEAMAGGSTSVLAQYKPTVTCVDGNNLQTGLPTAAAFTGSLSITPVSNSAISCTLSNSSAPPVVRTSVTLGSARFAAGDQFTVAVRTDSATGPVVNPTTNSTTAGTGSTVTTGSGTTGNYTGTPGATYYLTQASTANGKRYTSTITCVDSNGFQTGLPTNAPYRASVAITPVAGSSISCTITNTRAPAVLALAKSNPSTLTVDVAATYGLTVTNTGGAGSTGSRIKDQLPPNVAYVSAAGTGWNCTAAGTVAAGQVVTCTGPAIPAPGSSTVNLTVQPNATASGTTAVNRAAVDPTGGANPVDPTTCTANATPTDGCAVTPGLLVSAGVNLAITKTNPGALVVGTAADYTVTVTNSGSSPAASATVKDQLPADLTYNSASGATCTAAGQVLTCTVAGPIASGGGTAAFTVNVTPALAAGGTSVVNKAAVDPTGGSSPVAPSTCTADGAPTAGCAVTPALFVGNGTELGLAKTNPASLTVGVPADYTFTVTNGGSGSSPAATVVDVLPDGLVFNAASGATCTAVGRLLTCQIAGPIAGSGGTATFSVTVTPAQSAAGLTLANKAAVDATGGGNPVDPATCTADGAPDGGCAVTSGLLVGSGVDLSLAKSNPASLTVGVSGSYSMTVTNSGTGDAGSATVSDVLPADLSFDSASGAACTAAAQVLTCTVAGPIAAGGGTATFTVAVTPTQAAAGTTVANKAAVDPTGGVTPVDPATCTGADAPAPGCAVTPPQTVDPGIALALAKTNPQTLVVGVDATYSMTVTNSGTGAADTATVADELPPNLTYLSATGATCTAAGQRLTCTVTGPIAAGGGTAGFSVTVHPEQLSSGSSETNRAAVDPSGGTSPVDPTTCTDAGAPTAGCAVTAVLVVGAGIDLSLAKTNPGSLVVGVSAEYTLTVTNNGTGDAFAATVVDHLPPDITYGSATGATCTAAGQVLTCDISGTITAAGGTHVIVLTVTPGQAAAGQSVVNRAAVDTTGGGDPVDPATCTADGAPSAGCAVTPSLLVGGGIALRLAKTNPVGLTVGIPGTYSFTVTNTGTGQAASATVRDQLPDGLTYSSATGATCAAVGQAVTCTVPGPIAPAGTATFSITVDVLPVAGFTSPVNKAAVDVTGGNEPSIPSACTADRTPDPGCAVTPELFVGTGISLGLAKTNPLAMTVGMTSDYTLTVTNNGTGPSDSAYVNDLLPPGVDFVSATGASCAIAGALISCAVPGPIAANGGTASFTMTVAPTPAAAGLTVVNRALLDPSGGPQVGDPTACTGTDEPFPGCAVSVGLPVGDGIALSLVKSNPAHLLAGATSSYQLTVTNSGIRAAASASVADVLPAGLSYLSATGATCAAVLQLVTCTVPGLIQPAGSATFSIAVTVSPSLAGTTVRNHGAVDPTGRTSPPDPQTCTATGTPAGCALPPAQPVESGVALSLAKVNPPALTVGVPAPYLLRVTNSGTSPAVSATVTDMLPAGLRYVSAEGAVCTATGQQVSCTLTGPIAAGGGTQVFTLTVLPTAGSAGRPVVNRATVDRTGGTTPPVPGRCSATGVPAGCAVTPPLRPGTARLTLVKSATLLPPASGAARLGDTIRYRFLVTNASDATITAIAVTDVKAGTVTCPSATLPPRRSMTCAAADYSVTQIDVDAGAVNNTATASGRVRGCTGPGCVLAAPASVTHGPARAVADVTATKSAQWIDRNGNGRTDEGDAVRYTVRVSNIGTVTADLTVYDPLLTLTCATTSLPPGESVSCTGDLLIDATVAAAGRIVNTATVTVGGGPGHQQVQDVTNTVVTPIQPPAPPPARQLPNTGVAAAEQLLVALGLLLAGTALVLATRRRGRQSGRPVGAHRRGRPRMS